MVWKDHEVLRKNKDMRLVFTDSRRRHMKWQKLTIAQQNNFQKIYWQCK